ncbi:putative UDP-rhamnose:rhamnosyltransferase 1 [Rhodamnia argentea]|uniref:UDP-rhamnose:rhamnosyltransferase 1 n=1 Tax=Rhodamnia argentea TaxID=178133 RepID=A0ABM3GXJ7_9MYRT|nr:putative UDP-rhamnose:rhamnosyltransferase 1 [Rhodamnia argentea]
MASKQYEIMMFPWLAFGHILPFFELAKRLASKGIHISFISTPRNIQRLPPIPDYLIENINLVQIPLTSVDGLPENSEATIDLQLECTEYLRKACDGLHEALEQLLCEISPDLILFDFVQCWIPKIAAKFRVPSGYFSASELESFGRRKKPEDFAATPDWFPLTSLVSRGPHQAQKMFRNLYFPDKSSLSGGQRWAATLHGCEFVAVRSCSELEGEYLNLIRGLYQKPVVSVGLLPPIPKHKISDQATSSNWSHISKWLDKQARKSVVFVGFGTEYKMPPEEIRELAYGLELSEMPFFWILRMPGGLEFDSSELLPDGFLVRTSKRSMVSIGWVPQLAILGHPAIGGCLYHSGWSSIIESLGFGHPQILMPMVDDQGLNAKLLVEKGVGFEVPRNEDGSFHRDAVAKSIRLVMLEDQGEGLRVKAAHTQKIFADQDLHDSYINNFVEFLYSRRKVPSHTHDR